MGKVKVVHLDVEREYSVARKAEILQTRIFDHCILTDTGCRVWQRSVNRKGYGCISFECSHWAAHRLAYVLSFGALPPDQFVCHSCDNPACCEPSHFFLGDHLANQRDMIEKHRHFRMKRTHCWRGHPLSGDNVYIKPDDGARSCKTCSRDRQNRDWNAPDGWRKQYHKDRRARIKVQRQGEAS